MDSPQVQSPAEPAVVGGQALPQAVEQGLAPAEQQPAAEPLVINDPLAAETASFWRMRARTLVNDSPKALDDAAKQIVTVAGVVVGFYVNAILRADLTTQVAVEWLRAFFIAPIVVLLVAIVAGLWVIVPEIMPVNINSSRSGKVAHTLVLERKMRWFIVALWSLAGGVLLLCVSLLAYYLGK